MEHIGMNSKQFDLDVIQIVLENDNIDRRYNTKLVYVQIEDIVTESKVYDAQKGIKGTNVLPNYNAFILGVPRGFGDLGRRTNFFRDLGSTGNYFRGLGTSS